MSDDPHIFADDAEAGAMVALERMEREITRLNSQIRCQLESRVFMEKAYIDEITRLRAEREAALAESERLNKSRNRWGKKYNDCLKKLRLAVMSDSDECKELTEQNINLRTELAAAIAERDALREENKKLNIYLMDDPPHDVLLDTLSGFEKELNAAQIENTKLREVVKRADSYIHNGIELGFIRHCDAPTDPAHHTPRIVREAARAAIDGTEKAGGESE